MSDPYDLADDAPPTAPKPKARPVPTQPPSAAAPRGKSANLDADVPPAVSPRPRDEPLPVPATNFAAAASGTLKIAAALALIGVGANVLRMVLPLTSANLIDSGIFFLLGVAVFVANLVALAGLALYLFWQHGAYKLVRALGESTKFTAAMGVVWWLVPVANLIFTRDVLADLWRAAGATAGKSPAAAVETKTGGRPRLVWLVEVAWAVAAVFGFVVSLFGVAFFTRLGFLSFAVAYLFAGAFYYLLALYADDVERAIDAKMPKPKRKVAAAAPLA